MAFLKKCLFVSALIAATYGRYILQGRSINETSDDANCNCDWRYFKHYAVKGCVIETEDSCGCPQKFNCVSNQTQQTPAKVCIYQNKEYRVGSKIITSNICQVCRCRDGIPPQISCIAYECPQLPAVQGENCHLVYKEDKCCPIGYNCVENELEDSEEMTRNNSKTTCEYNGQIYPFGSKIYPEDDPCQICICNENWNGSENSSCYEQDCVLEKNKSKLDAGCIPVYHERRCCPIEFYCPPSYHNISYSRLSNNESSKFYNASDVNGCPTAVCADSSCRIETSPGNECPTCICRENNNLCFFAGDLYELGEELYIGVDPCVKCTCAVPPDFTCLLKSCPPPPMKGKCQRIYNPGECCPSYECMLGDAPDPVPDGCPTPICADSSCRIEIPPGHECPTCICRENISELEHNNLEQVQQISQNVDKMQPLEQAYESVGNSYDDSEDELQMMPLRIQDSDGQYPILEKMILPEDNQYPEALRELEENSNEDNSSFEAVFNVSKELMLSERKNSTLSPEPEFNDTYFESLSNQSDRVMQKRSEVHDSVVPVEQKESTQGTIQEFNEDIEREGIEPDGNDENFDDELENFKNKIFDKNGTIINEIITINHTVKVPPGCPTPLCEGPWCKIGIPQGHLCPTCICKRHIDNEP